MKKVVILAIVAAVILAGCATAVLKGDSVAKVNRQTLTRQELCWTARGRA